jgi:hypothetical protein
VCICEKVVGIVRCSGDSVSKGGTSFKVGENAVT